MHRVIIESPYAGSHRFAIVRWAQKRRNVRYARACLLDSLARGEAPIASHLLYTQVLDDRIPHERRMGMDAGLAWRVNAQASVVYTDFGISPGMKYGIEAARRAKIPVVYRKLKYTRADD